MEPNSPAPDRPVSDDELHALVDGRVVGDRRRALEQRLARDPLAAATFAAWQQQRAAVTGLHAELLSEPVPPSLALALGQMAAARSRLDPWWRWGGMAAGVILAFGMGWLSHGQYGRDLTRAADTGIVAAGIGERDFARQASVAHLVYAPEVRHPVEVTAAQQEHLVQWLSKRLGRALKVPNLSKQGFELVGGRLLPGTDGARAQFMFQSASGERITLYLGALRASGDSTPTAPGAPDRRETAFSYSADSQAPGFYWVDQGFGYALAGNLAKERLMALAQLVYQQL